MAATLNPSDLALPPHARDRIPPRPSGYARHRELFARYTGDAFDPISPAAIAADVTIGFILEPDRSARLVAQHAIDPALPGLDEVIQRLIKATASAAVSPSYEQEIRRVTVRVLVERLMWLAGGAPMPQVRAIAAVALGDLRQNG